MSKIAIVTDSSSDIPKGLIDQFQIHVVPNIIVIDGQDFQDGRDISRSEFYENLLRMKTPPTTSTSSPGEYQQLYGNLLQQGTSQIISIHASSQLSGIYNAASVGASTLNDRVRVIDSENISLGLGFQVLAAAEATKTLPLESILSLVKDVRRRTRVVAMLDTLEYLRRGGRISWARARIGELLHIKSFVEVIDGNVTSRGETRTRKKGIQRLLNMVRQLGPLERLAILHSNAEFDARGILAELSPQIPTEPLLVNVNTVIGTHVGPNGLGFAAVVK